MPTFGLAFLDLLSCAFGAVIILAVIVSASASQRSRVQSMVALVDVELRLAHPDGATTSLSEYPFTVTIAGPRWTGTWQEERPVTPVHAELTDLSAVALCVPDSTCLSRHETVTGQGVEPGRYAISVFGHRSPSEDIYNAPLSLKIRAYYDGARVLEAEKVLVLREVLQESSTLWFGYAEFHPARTR